MYGTSANKLSSSLTTYCIIDFCYIVWCYDSMIESAKNDINEKKNENVDEIEYRQNYIYNKIYREGGAVTPLELHHQRSR